MANPMIRIGDGPWLPCEVVTLAIVRPSGEPPDSGSAVSLGEVSVDFEIPAEAGSRMHKFCRRLMGLPVINPHYEPRGLD